MNDFLHFTFNFGTLDHSESLRNFAELRSVEAIVKLLPSDLRLRRSWKNVSHYLLYIRSQSTLAKANTFLSSCQSVVDISTHLWSCSKNDAFQLVWIKIEITKTSFLKFSIHLVVKTVCRETVSSFKINY